MSLRKGQAAMEYLMTYGWAILVIVIVLAALLYLGVFNVAARTPEICTLPIGLQCPSFKLSANGMLNFSLTNGFPKTIYVDRIACSNDPNFNPGSISGSGSLGWSTVGTTIPSADAKYVNVTCYNPNNDVADGAIGDTYRGNIYVRYYFTDETGNYRVAIGDIVTKYQP